MFCALACGLVAQTARLAPAGWDTLIAIAEGELPAGVHAAWEVPFEVRRGQGLRVHAWQSTDAPEVLIVVSVSAEECSLADAAAQVGVERGTER